MRNNNVVKTTATNVVQILANTQLQHAVNCVMPQLTGESKVYKAGTPLTIDLSNLQTDAKVADATNVLNAVLLHDVDTTYGKNNGAALIFGFVNLNRLDADTQALVATALTNTGAISKNITFLKV